MFKKITRTSLIIFFLCLEFYLFPLFKPAAAQNFSLSITPPLLEIVSQPGKTINYSYKLTNQGVSSQIYSTVFAFTPQGEEGGIEINPHQLTEEQFLNWFSFEDKDLDLGRPFFLKTGQTKQLVLKINIPQNIQEKDYYASLVFQVQPEERMIGASGSQISGLVASNILLTVSSTSRPAKKGQILEFSFPKTTILGQEIGFYDSFQTIPFNLKVANKGSFFFKPLGSVKIINQTTKKEELLTILPQNILAKSQRKLFLKGSPQQPLQATSWYPKGKIGFFKAQASFLLSGSQEKLEAETTFFLFPWKLSLGLGGLLILFFLIKKNFLKS